MNTQTHLTHIDSQNNPTMVNVSSKDITLRTATACGSLHVHPDIMKQFIDGDIQTKKGPVFHTAIIAGTMGTKKTADLIPFCHSLVIEGCKIRVHANVEKNMIDVEAEVQTTGKTGVEMEALTAVTISLLTIYDMCKAISPEMTLTDVHLTQKRGGKRDYDAK